MLIPALTQLYDSEPPRAKDHMPSMLVASPGAGSRCALLNRATSVDPHAGIPILCISAESRFCFCAMGGDQVAPWLNWLVLL